MITHSGDTVSVAATGVKATDLIVRHAHYYDAALHRAITESGSSTGRLALERAAASAAYRALAGTVGRDAVTELYSLFATTGLGTIQACDLGPKTATVAVSPSAYVRARREMFGEAKAPACDVARGVIAGALGALFGGAFVVREEECVGTGAPLCRFVAVPGEGEHGLDPLARFEWPAERSGEAAPHAAPSELVLSALSTDAGELVGPTYGRLWAELYARAAYDFEQEIPRTMGPKFSNLASVVLTEAAHLGTFYSVGGLIRSPEWRERVAPLLTTREEWVRAIVGLVESFGWGSWHVETLDPGSRFTVHVRDGYEAVSYLALTDEPAPAPRCYFARGFVGGLMNVLFAGDVLGSALNQTLYNSLFRSLSSFRAVETRCLASGDHFCEFVANPLSSIGRSR